jgi:hypothetical protein
MVFEHFRNCFPFLLCRFSQAHVFHFGPYGITNLRYYSSDSSHPKPELLENSPNLHTVTMYLKISVFRLFSDVQLQKEVEKHTGLLFQRNKTAATDPRKSTYIQYIDIYIY